MSISWSLDVEPAPRILVLPPGAASLDEAHAAIELWEHYSGKTLDPTQRLVVEVMMAEGSSDRWAAATTGREMPRQNGKGDEIEVPELWGLVQRSEAILHTVHDAVLLASQAQQRMLHMLDHPDLRRRVKRKWMGTGQQMIEMRNGGIIWYRTRTGGGGRGVDDIDRLVIDEAQHATEEHLAAVAPTMLANKNPQLNAMGTSALEGRSDWWWGVRKRALGGDPGSFGYVGHTAEVVRLEDDGRVVQEPVDVSDRKMWLISNPAITAGRDQVLAGLEEEFRNLSPESFAAEHLGVWAPPPSERAAAKLPAEQWRDSIGADKATVAGEITFAFDVSVGYSWASIVAGKGTIAEPYVDLIEHRQGVGWLPERIVALVEKWKPTAVGVNGAGPAGAQVAQVLQALRDAGHPDELLRLLNGVEYKQACGGFYTDVVEGRLKRPHGQQALDLAGEDAAERPLGDAWAWDLRSATVPISPLVAATIARALLPTEAEVVVDVAANVW